MKFIVLFLCAFSLFAQQTAYDNIIEMRKQNDVLKNDATQIEGGKILLTAYDILYSEILKEYELNKNNEKTTISDEIKKHFIELNIKESDDFYKNYMLLITFNAELDKLKGDFENIGSVSNKSDLSIIVSKKGNFEKILNFENNKGTRTVLTTTLIENINNLKKTKFDNFINEIKAINLNIKKYSKGKIESIIDIEDSQDDLPTFLTKKAEITGNDINDLLKEAKIEPIDFANFKAKDLSKKTVELRTKRQELVIIYLTKYNLFISFNSDLTKTNNLLLKLTELKNVLNLNVDEKLINFLAFKQNFTEMSNAIEKSSSSYEVLSCINEAPYYSDKCKTIIENYKNKESAKKIKKVNIDVYQYESFKSSDNSQTSGFYNDLMGNFRITQNSLTDEAIKLVVKVIADKISDEIKEQFLSKFKNEIDYLKNLFPQTYKFITNKKLTAKDLENDKIWKNLKDDFTFMLGTIIDNFTENQELKGLVNLSFKILKEGNTKVVDIYNLLENLHSECEKNNTDWCSNNDIKDILFLAKSILNQLYNSTTNAFITVNDFNNLSIDEQKRFISFVILNNDDKLKNIIENILKKDKKEENKESEFATEELRKKFQSKVESFLLNIIKTIDYIEEVKVKLKESIDKQQTSTLYKLEHIKSLFLFIQTIINDFYGKEGTVPAFFNNYSQTIIDIIKSVYQENYPEVINITKNLFEQLKKDNYLTTDSEKIKVIEQFLVYAPYFADILILKTQENNKNSAKEYLIIKIEELFKKFIGKPIIKSNKFTLSLIPYLRTGFGIDTDKNTYFDSMLSLRGEATFENNIIPSLQPGIFVDFIGLNPYFMKPSGEKWDNYFDITTMNAGFFVKVMLFNFIDAEFAAQTPYYFTTGKDKYKDWKFFMFLRMDLSAFFNKQLKFSILKF